MPEASIAHSPSISPNEGVPSPQQIQARLLPKRPRTFAPYRSCRWPMRQRHLQSTLAAHARARPAQRRNAKVSLVDSPSHRNPPDSPSHFILRPHSHHRTAMTRQRSNRSSARSACCTQKSLAAHRAGSARATIVGGRDESAHDVSGPHAWWRDHPRAWVSQHLGDGHARPACVEQGLVGQAGLHKQAQRGRGWGVAFA